MISDRIRVGIIGANLSNGDPLRHSWGVRAHLPALKALPEIDVVAVCTTHMETAQATARHFNIPLAFENAEAMVQHPDVDLVDVCVNVTSHHQLVSLALNAGKHVFCEWPLGMNLAEAQELRDLAEARGVKHMIGLQSRAAPVYDYMKQLVANGYVGRVLSCSMAGSMTMAPSPRSAGYSLIHAGHCLDTLFSVLGEELQQGSTIVANDPVANHILVNGRLASGAFVDINIRHIPVLGTGFSFEVDGTDGVLVASIDAKELPGRGIRSLGEQLNQVTLRSGRKGEPVAELVVPAEHRWVPAEVPSGPPLGVAQMFRKFAESIRTGTRVEADFALAVKRHELFARLERASEKGTVSLESNRRGILT